MWEIDQDVSGSFWDKIIRKDILIIVGKNFENVVAYYTS
jgi:hypothetical protein